MKIVTIALCLPEDLYDTWTRRAGDDDVSLNEAIVKLMMRNRPGPTVSNGTPRTSQTPLPQKLNPMWGGAESRRWDDLKGREYQAGSSPHESRELATNPSEIRRE